MTEAPAAEYTDVLRADGTAVRRRWLDLLRRIAEPVLEAGAARELHEAVPHRQELTEAQVTFEPLVTVARTALGLAGWLSREPDDPREREGWQHDAERCRAMIAGVVDPDSPDSGDFATSNLTVCYGAQLAQALLTARATLFDPLDERTKRHLRDAFVAQRGQRIPLNNWLLFAAVNETMLAMCFDDYEPRTVSHALDMHERWYLGDGIYGDGDHFAGDYYNSFVIHPVMLLVLEHLADSHEPWAKMLERQWPRAKQAAAMLERMIGPEGAFPPLGRSLCYRFGVLRLLAEMARREALPDALPPGQVRTAMAACIDRIVAGGNLFDDRGWLTHGLVGEQPGMAESYMTTGSLYFCLTALSPLALPGEHPFWSDPSRAWTSRRIWAGENVTPEQTFHEYRPWYW